MTLATLVTIGRLPAIVEETLAPHMPIHRLGRSPAADMPSDMRAAVWGIACGAHAPLDAETIDLFPALEIVASFGVGYDSIDVTHCAARGVCVTNTPDVLTEEVADTAMGLLLMTVRELSSAERYLRAGRWASQGAYPLTEMTLRDRTLGILGLGRIGKAVARRAEAFGLAVHYHGRRPQGDVEYPYHATLEGLAEACDTLMVVAPGGAGTHHLVDASVLAALGPRGVVVNVGRGTVIDEAALITALRSGTIQGAGLDVFEDEPTVPKALMALDRVVLLPHVGSASIHTRNAMGKLVADNVLAWFRHGEPCTPVPETRLVKSG